MKFQKNVEKIVLAHWDKTSNNIAIYSPKNVSWIKKNISEINELWDGIVIYSEQRKKRTLKIKSYPINLANIIAIIGSILFLTSITLHYGYKTGIIFLTILIGIFLSVCSLIKDYGYKSDLLKKICHVSSHIDCEKVSASRYGKLLGAKISEWATSYFISQLIISLIIVIESNIPFSILEPTMIVTIPVFIYSVSAQILVKRICFFCAGILGVLLTQTILMMMLYGEMHIHIYVTVITLALTLFLIFIIKTTKKNFNKNFKLREACCEVLSFKRKKYVILNESIKFNPCDGIVIFNDKSETSAEDIVTSIISPSCPNCKRMAKEILNLFEGNIVSFHWKIILGETHVIDKELNRNWIVSYINDPQTFFSHLKKWCIDEYQYLPIQSEGESNLTKQYQECFDRTIKEYKLTGLPRLAINDKLLSYLYNETDILYLLVDKEIKKN